MTVPSSAAEAAEVVESDVAVRVQPAGYSMEASKRFLLPAAEREYQRQFYHVYRKRLESLRVRIETAASSRFPSVKLLRGLCDLEEAKDAEEATEEAAVVVVVGTVFKSGDLKPSILKQLCVDEHEEQEVPDAKEVPDEEGVEPVFRRFVDPADELVLEDESQRIRLVGPGIRPDLITSGVVCGVLGRQEGSGSKGGKFLVQDLVFPSYPEVVTRRPELLPSPSTRTRGQVVLVSGLELSGAQASGSFLPLGLEMFCQWILGEMGAGARGGRPPVEDEAAEAAAERVERVVVAGNSLTYSARADREAASGRARYLSRGQEAGSLEAVRALDGILAQLCRSVPVDLMAGPNDPTGQMLPQQPMHRCLFPNAGALSTLQTVTNPYSFTTGGRTLVGTSGQNVTDIMRNTSIEDPLDALERILEWAHLAPTCPDTLGCYPFKNEDPLILPSAPDFLFAGNQPKFGSRRIKSKKTVNGRTTTLISVPSFAKTGQVVLVNLETMECTTLAFPLSLD